MTAPPQKFQSQRLPQQNDVIRCRFNGKEGKFDEITPMNFPVRWSDGSRETLTLSELAHLKLANGVWLA